MISKYFVERKKITTSLNHNSLKKSLLWVMVWLWNSRLLRKWLARRRISNFVLSFSPISEQDTKASENASTSNKRRHRRKPVSCSGLCSCRCCLSCVFFFFLIFFLLSFLLMLYFIRLLNIFLTSFYFFCIVVLQLLMQFTVANNC